jgi:hypothetical protein
MIRDHKNWSKEAVQNEWKLPLSHHDWGPAVEIKKKETGKRKSFLKASDIFTHIPIYIWLIKCYKENVGLSFLLCNIIT